MLGALLLSFAMARNHARRLGLKGTREWHAWAKSDKRPTNIPGNPARTYRDSGWISTADWLGYEERRRGQKRNRVEGPHHSEDDGEVEAVEKLAQGGMFGELDYLVVACTLLSGCMHIT